MMLGPLSLDGSSRRAIRIFLIGCAIGVALVLGVIGWGMYRIASAVWGGQ